MGYLICNKCDGYYELQEGENPEDFGRCQCGGDLQYVDELKNPRFTDKLLKTINVRRISGIIIGAVIVLSTFYIFSPDPYSSSFVYNNNLSLYIWGAGGLVAALIAGGNIRSGASNGFYAAFISGLLVILLYYFMANNNYLVPSLADNLAFFGALCVVYLLIPGVFSTIGGLIAAIARKTMVKLI